MRVLAIYPHLRTGEKKTPHTKRYFPWGFATVLSYVENAGHEVVLVDAYGNDLVKQEVSARIEQEHFDCVCISGFASYNYPYVVWLVNEVKRKRDVPVIVGGLLADLHHELLLVNGNVDVCVLGEGEKSVVDLLNNMGRLDGVKNIAYRHNGEVFRTSQDLYVENLDTLPWPNFDLWNMDRYTIGDTLWTDDLSTRATEYRGVIPLSPLTLKPNMSIFAGRGCPYRCTFCSRSCGQFRCKSVNRVIEEMSLLKDRFGIKAFHFYDELLVTNRTRIMEFCDRVSALNVYWDCQARVNTVTKEIMSAMKNAKCISIGLGLESGSDRLLKAMKKGITRQESRQVLQWSREVGLHLKLQFMFGYPGETKETLRETVSLLRGTGLPPRRLTWCTPLPGSELYETVKKEGLIGDEEAYLRKLAKRNMNAPGALVLNVSGTNDAEMIRLYYWTHYCLERDYLLFLLRSWRNPFGEEFRSSLRRLWNLIQKYLASVSFDVRFSEFQQRGKQFFVRVVKTVFGAVSWHARTNHGPMLL